MVIKLYTQTIPKNKMFRNLTNEITITGNVKDTFDILNPIVQFNYNVNLKNVNYAYIPEFGRYYFVSPPIISGKTAYLKMHVDVLFTYKAIIMKSPCIAIRSSNRGNLYFQDDYIQFEEGYRYNVSKFPYRFDAESGTYIICISGR